MLFKLSCFHKTKIKKYFAILFNQLLLIKPINLFNSSVNPKFPTHSMGEGLMFWEQYCFNIVFYLKLKIWLLAI